MSETTTLTSRRGGDKPEELMPETKEKLNGLDDAPPDHATIRDRIAHFTW